jgi:hypothetical protein
MMNYYELPLSKLRALYQPPRLPRVNQGRLYDTVGRERRTVICMNLMSEKSKMPCGALWGLG